MTGEFVAPQGKIKIIHGRCISLIGDDIDTDRIIPARFLKCVTFDSLGSAVFEDDRKDLKGKHPFDLKINKHSSILLVNSNFGCGSSREHAPQALLRWGIRAIIGESFAEIFYSNCVAIGIPCFTMDKISINKIQEKSEKGLIFDIDISKAEARNSESKFKLEIKSSSRNMFLSGEWDATSTLLNNASLIEEKIKKLPYVQLNEDFSK